MPLRATGVVAQALGVPSGTGVDFATVPAGERWKLAEVSLAKDGAGAANVVLYSRRGGVTFRLAVYSLPTAPSAIRESRETVLNSGDVLGGTWTTLATLSLWVSAYVYVLP